VSAIYGVMLLTLWIRHATGRGEYLGSPLQAWRLRYDFEHVGTVVFETRARYARARLAGLGADQVLASTPIGAGMGIFTRNLRHFRKNPHPFRVYIVEAYGMPACRDPGPRVSVDGDPPATRRLGDRRRITGGPGVR